MRAVSSAVRPFKQTALQYHIASTVVYDVLYQIRATQLTLNERLTQCSHKKCSLPVILREHIQNRTGNNNGRSVK